MERRESPTRELERPSRARAQANPEGVGAGHSTASTGVQDNAPGGKALQPDTLTEENRLVSVAQTKPPEDKTTELQRKLYQAAKADATRRFHALYDKLSLPYILEEAWKNVRENGGAAGIDQQTLDEIEAAGVPQFLEGIAQELREKSYKPQPVRRVYIGKGEGKVRPLGIPTVRDRVVQAAMKLLLEPIFEADFGSNSYGFRPGIGQQQALNAVAAHSVKRFSWVVDGDIEQFFDTLDHEVLMEALRKRISDGEVLRVIYRWLKAGYFLDGRYFKTDQGSPQGGVLSPLLANVYLHTVDKAQSKERRKTFIGKIVRYADDFVIQCGTEKDAKAALAWMDGQLRALRLRLHPEKTRLVRDKEGFDFLGFHHRQVKIARSERWSYGVLRWPSEKAKRRFRERIRELIGPRGQIRGRWKETLAALERYLKGWCQYFRHGQSSDVFRKLDRYVEQRIARSLARSQPRGKKHRRVSWGTIARGLRATRVLPKLAALAREPFKAYRGQANVRWRAV
jgi:RNA-directed DNA polymerase